MTIRAVSSHAAAGITMPGIVDAALAVIAERGVDGLTMRSVADRLGVRAPSLYHHVSDKDALLDLVAQGTFAPFTDHVPAYARVTTLDGWLELTADGSRRLRAFYTDHPGLAAVVQRTAGQHRDRGDGPRAALVRAQIDSLERLGLSAQDARDAFETCARWTMAAVAAESAVGGADLAYEDAVFERGLSWLLDGLRADLTGREATD